MHGSSFLLENNVMSINSRIGLCEREIFSQAKEPEGNIAGGTLTGERRRHAEKDPLTVAGFWAN